MKLLLDMNIPQVWEPFLCDAGHAAVHWSSIGDIRAEHIVPRVMGAAVLAALAIAEPQLNAGALVTIDPRRHRVRALPLRRSADD